MKNKVLIISLFALSGALASDTPHYEFSGEKAVAYLIRNGQCRDCDLSNQDLRAVMAEVNLKYRKRCMFTDLSGANLSHANLSGVDLSHATMRDADFTGADLTNANLSDTIMTGINLTGANLTNADLSYAILTDADLTGADLTGADLTGASGLYTVTGYTPTK